MHSPVLMSDLTELEAIGWATKAAAMLCLVWYTDLPTYNYDKLVNGFVCDKEKR